MMDRAIPKKCLLVLTREFPQRPSTGRERILAQIRAALGSHARIIEFRVFSLSELRSWMAWSRAAAHWLCSVLHFNPLPLQVLLFFSPKRIDELVRIVRTERPYSVYFDGVRCAEYLRAVRADAPNLKLVCDFDDLMSRRMDLLRASRLGISAGYLSKFVPGWIRRHVLQGPLGRLVVAYEFSALKSVEVRTLAMADSSVFSSQADADCLAHRVGHAIRRRITVIPPSVAVRRPMRSPSSPVRFVFLGSDSLTQNRLTIEWLVQLWSEAAPATTLNIYGKMQRHYRPIANVHFEGFAESLADVYTATSILLAPAFLAGGIKTKVLEAIEHGIIVIGNATTFEGLGIEVDGLALTEREIREVVCRPADYLSSLTSAAAAVQLRCLSYFDPARIHERWTRLMSLQESSHTAI